MDFTQLFLKVADTRPEFREAVEIVRSSSEGKIWLIGGFVCRSIIQELYNVPMPAKLDLDFIVEKAAPLQVPAGWQIINNSYGNPKLVGPTYTIDYIPLNTIHSIIRRGLPPTIENFLTGTPLNVQSISFDVTAGKIIGDIGIKSIQEKVIAINNPEQAAYRAGNKGVTPADLVESVAKQFGFRSALL